MQNDRLIEIARSLVGDISLSGGNSAGSVGAVLLTAKNNVYSGICLDYACGLGFCAEHAAVAEMLKHRETEIITIVAVSEKRILPPCGRCRELILLTNPVNSKTQVIISEDRAIELSTLLPHHWLESRSNNLYKTS